MKQLETDVVVVAAGLSGLAASVAAAESGARVITLEKASNTGGAANMGMGPAAAAPPTWAWARPLPARPCRRPR